MSKRIEELIFESRKDADEVLNQLKELIHLYGTASLADYYDLCAKSHDYTSCKYGWTDLSEVTVMVNYHGYKLNLPETMVLGEEKSKTDGGVNHEHVVHLTSTKYDDIKLGDTINMKISFEIPNEDKYTTDHTLYPKEVLQKAYKDKIGSTINFGGLDRMVTDVEITEKSIIVKLASNTKFIDFAQTIADSNGFSISSAGKKVLNHYEEYVIGFAKNHGISTAEAREHPSCKARLNYFNATGK